MKAKINKQLLLDEGFSEGFVWIPRYSSDENADKYGRWARIGYYNGFMICWISKLNTNGVTNIFLTVLLFPCSANQGGESKKFNNIEDAKQYTIDMFEDFKKLINK